MEKKGRRSAQKVKGTGNEGEKKIAVNVTDQVNASDCAWKRPRPINVGKLALLYQVDV